MGAPARDTRARRAPQAAHDTPVAEVSEALADLRWIAGAPTRRDASTGIVVRTLGRTDYERCSRAMRAWTDARERDTPDELWLTEHAPVYTLGLAGRREHLLRDNGIPSFKVDRGGQVTYHGPGQLVVYVMVDLARRRLGVRELVRRLEAAVVEWLGSSGIDARGKPSAPGVYVSRDGVEAKIAALGLKVRNGRTYHGIAVNVAMDLSPFADIDPCGYPGLAVAQVSEFGVATDVARAGETLAPILARTIARPSP
ncbi:MAG: lipoyl(octanoyl) transferase LipB [Burkholderiales bacterium]|nr:lipoyl(octanoyl) transferase LipB [Burkholderiales bacterium]MCE7876579.1 lipoyl(octanoyl) transferase LipB [Betaproteobacteria bacterium PRO3]